MNPEKVYNYMWTLPSGWSANGITSTGSNEIPGGSYITATYPASSTSGTIKVKGYQAIIGWDATTQSSKYATASIVRNVTINLTANKSYFLCGDTSPITFTVTANPELPCALYYWNNSTTPTTSNTIQISPDGQNNLIVAVKIVYGNTTVNKSITVQRKIYVTTPILSTPSFTCNSTFTCTVLNLGPGYTVNWGNHSNNLELLSQTGFSATFECSGTGDSWVEPTYSTPMCGGGYPVSRKTIWVGGGSFILHVSRPDGVPVSIGQFGDLEACPYTDYEFYIESQVGGCHTVDNYWSVPTTWTINSEYGGFISINTNDDPNNFIAVDANDCCMTPIYLSQYFDYEDYCYQYSLLIRVC
jgi:hypothetical protein